MTEGSGIHHDSRPDPHLDPHRGHEVHFTEDDENDPTS